MRRVPGGETELQNTVPILSSGRRALRGRRRRLLLARRLLLLEDVELDAAVRLAAARRPVVGDGLVAAPPLRDEVRRRDALAHEEVDHRLRAFLRQRAVLLRVA